MSVSVCVLSCAGWLAKDSDTAILTNPEQEEGSRKKTHEDEQETKQKQHFVVRVR